MTYKLPLASLIDDTVTTITVVGSNLNSSITSGTITIESEEITYTSSSTNQFFGCTRGANGTSPAAHIAGTHVTIAVDSLPTPVLSDANILTNAPLTGGASIGSGVNLSISSYLGVLADDPMSPAEGDMWYNSTTHLLKYQDDGGVQVVATV